MTERCRHHGRVSADIARTQSRGVSGERSETQRAVHLDRVQLRNPVDINEDAGPSESHIEHGNEALTTRQDLRVVSVLSQKTNGILHRVRSCVLEWCRLHEITPRSIVMTA